ncbi:MAG TPA: hypothetical protein VK281_11030, partial [Xanthobacteraceae bacterium]|nr:hypothetical protein [Xanthobacteraceae bacterium]
MSQTDTVLENHRAYLLTLAEGWADTCRQWPLLANLALRHGEMIGRTHTEAAYATWTGMQNLMAGLATTTAADAFSDYVRDCGQRWILFLDTLCRRGNACIVRQQEGF